MPKPTKKRKNDRKIQPANPAPLAGCEVHHAGGESDIERGQDEHLAPADAVAHPAPEKGARDGAETGRDQDHGRLAIGQLPLLQDEGQHIADEKEIKEIEHIADIGSGDDLPLIGGQFFLFLQALQHGVLSAGQPSGRL